MKTAKTTTEYVYDALGRREKYGQLPIKMEICTNNKTTTASQYAYDALGRRIGKYDAAAMETTFYYYNDQWQILAEYDGAAFGNRYVYGNYIDEVLVMNDGTDDYYYAHDHLYSPARARAIGNNA